MKAAPMASSGDHRKRRFHTLRPRDKQLIMRGLHISIFALHHKPA